MALFKCPNCGKEMSDKAFKCPECKMPMEQIMGMLMKNGGNVQSSSIEQKPNVSVPPAQPVNTTPPANQPVTEPTPTQETPKENPVTPSPKQEEKKKIPTKILIFIISGVLLVAAIVAFLFYRTNVYLPAKRDANAPRYYVMARNLNMRSSPDFDVEHNKIGSLTYGTEVIVYDSVKSSSKPYIYGKFAPIDARGKVVKDKCIEGYLSYDYMATKADYFLLNSIYGNEDARNMLSEVRYKKALLNYFKKNNYRGDISNEKIDEYGIGEKFKTAERWQVFCRYEKAKSNNVYRSKKYRKDSKYPDLAVIIKNIDSGERKMLYFVYEDDESFHLLLEQPAPSDGYMKDRTLKLNKSGNDSYKVTVEYED